MKKRKHEKNFIRNRSGGMKQKLPGRLLSLMCALVLVLSTVLLDLGHISAYAFGDELYLETEAEETAEAGAEAQAADLGDDESQINTELSEDISEDPAEVSAEEAEDASEADFSSGDNLDEQELTTEEPGISDDSAAETITYTQLINNDTVEVRAEAPAGALPEGAQLVVKQVRNNTEDAEETEKYNTLNTRLTELLQTKAQNLEGFLPYNISFTDSEGNPVEPAAKVSYSFQYKEAAAPELTDPTKVTVSAAELKKNKETSEYELTELKAEEDKATLETNENKQLQRAGFQSADTAVFAFVWSNTTETTDNTGNEGTQEVTPVGTIEITADEVNLRQAPSTEAEILAITTAGTQFPLLETVTAEDESTWYKVSYTADTAAYVRSDMAIVLDENQEEEVPAEEAPAEITRYDYQSDEVNVKVTLTNPSDLPDDAELSVTPVELSQEAEEQITQEAIEEKKAIENIRSYDIKFLVDGEEVQPGATVKVEVSFPDEETAQDAAVYHVDQDEKVENMDGSINKEGNVEFETTHFSTYVIVNKKTDGSKITVTVQHYEQATGTEEAKKIYADDVRELQVGQQVDCKKALNWNIAEVKVNTGGSEDKTVTPDSSGKIYLAQDATVKVYYTPSTGTTVGTPTFYDYTVKAVNDDQTGQYGYPSINQNSNYPSGASSTERITMGAYTHQYSGKYQYTWKKDNYMVNDWTGSSVVVKGLLGGVKKDNSVVFNYPEPGLFVNSDMTDSRSGKSLRKVYKDFKLGFERNGDTYTLKEVRNSSGTDVAGLNGYDYESGNNFFPLDGVDYDEYSKKLKTDSNINNDSVHNGPHNYYFGMRYDITFNLKDYIGDLNYSFTGDDDMWVVLDKGKYEEGSGKVIIDLGGIHDAASADVDLWKELFGSEYAKEAPDKYTKRASLTEDQKNEEHTLTVLYLERGAGLSNCKMNFTLPNAEISPVTTTDLASFTFTKVKKDNKTPLPGATFKLYTDSECTTEFKTKTSGENGTVTFDKLFPGTYYMKEVQAPDGYVASSEVWTVEVPTGSTTATLKDSKGNTVTSIINETPEEIINSSMVASKTAKVKDWDQRTYDITINATSTSTSTITQTKTPIADIMLVLDVSGSMADPIYSYEYYGENTDAVRNKMPTRNTYYMYVNGAYKKMEYRSGGYFDWETKWRVYDGGWYDAKDSRYNDCVIYTRTSSGTRLDALKTAVNQFIDDTAKKSPNSKIGITVFSSSGYGAHGDSVSLGIVGDADSAKVSELKTFVNELEAEGGTDPSVGLLDAKNKLDAETDENPKYVVLFTDGKPTGGGAEWDTDAQQDAEKQANELRTGNRGKAEKKKDPYTVYTIGFALDDEGDRAKTFLSGGEYNGEKYPGIASSSECAKTADDAASLTQIFQSISGSISENIDITGATITDVIDKRFEIMDQGKVITDKDFNQEHKYTLQNGGVVTKREDGTYQVQWTDQTIKHTTDGTNGWSQTISVKAKDTFIGGNNIPTNVSPESKISVGDLEKVLDQPKVNVKVKLLIQNKEIFIYKGDTTVPTVADVQEAMFDTSGATSYERGTISAADAKDRITYKWYKKDASGNRVDIAAANVTKEIEAAPADSTEYYLEVIYKPVEEPTADSNSNTTTGDKIAHFVGDEKAHNKDNNENLYGTYKINVIKGKIQIKKTVTEAAKEGRTFTFNVKDSTGKDISGSPVTVTVEADQTSGTAVIENLPRGTYTVTEQNNDSYQIKKYGVVSGETDCQSSSGGDKVITFTLGNDTSENDVIRDYTYTSGGVNGVASYTNEMVTSLDLKKIAADTGTSLTGAKFKLEKKVSDDKWDPVKPENSDNGFEVLNGDDQVELTNLTSGDYRLTEITAPTGYMVLSSEIQFKVTQGKVTLTNAQGTASSMWELTTDTTKPPVLTIKNQKVYSLPEAGGNGIYWYMIGGMLLMVTSAWILYKNKCKEVLGK